MNYIMFDNDRIHLGLAFRGFNTTTLVDTYIHNY